MSHKSRQIIWKIKILSVFLQIINRLRYMNTVFLVYDNDQQEGLTPFHIASTQEKAEKWLKEFLKEHTSYIHTADIIEVNVDDKKRIMI